MKFKHSFSTPQYSGNYIRQVGVPFNTNQCENDYNRDPVGFPYQICTNNLINKQNLVTKTPFGRCNNWRFVNTSTEISNQNEIIDGTLVITENGEFRNPRLSIFEISPQAIYRNIGNNRI
jgi:hypothetical protein